MRVLTVCLLVEIRSQAIKAGVIPSLKLLQLIVYSQPLCRCNCDIPWKKRRNWTLSWSKSSMQNYVLKESTPHCGQSWLDRHVAGASIKTQERHLGETEQPQPGNRQHGEHLFTITGESWFYGHCIRLANSTKVAMKRLISVCWLARTFTETDWVVWASHSVVRIHEDLITNCWLVLRIPGMC